MATSLQAMLQEVLRRHGQETSVEKDWILVSGQLPAFRASLFRSAQWHPDACQLDIEVLVDKDTIVVESFGSTGETDEEGARNALAKFCQNSLHPLLAGLCQSDVEVTKEIWSGPSNQRWAAYLSKWQVLQYEGEGGCVPDQLFEQLQSLIESRLTDGNLHWCRMFYSNIGDTASAELLWDNEPWSEGEQLVRGADWADRGLYSVRGFFLFRRMESQEAG